MKHTDFNEKHAGSHSNSEGYSVEIPAYQIVSDKYYSRHLYRGSAFETSDSCGNCDGANCDDCVLLYRVELVAELEPDEYTSIDWRTTKDFNEIEELKDELEKDAVHLIRDYMS